MQVGYETWSRLIADHLTFIAAQGYEYEKLVKNIGDATLGLSSPSGDHNSKMITIFVKILMKLYQNLGQDLSIDGPDSSSKRDVENALRFQALFVEILTSVKVSVLISRLSDRTIEMLSR